MARGRVGRVCNRRPAPRGFTLIELLVVLVIIAILVSMATLAIGNDRAAAIQQEAQRALTLIDLAGDEATLQGRTLGLQLSRHGYRFLYLDPQPDGKAQWRVVTRDQVLRPRTLPAGMELQLLLDDLPQALPAEPSDKEKPQLFLFASGERTPFKLRFAAGNDDGYEVTAGPLGPPLLSQVQP